MIFFVFAERIILSLNNVKLVYILNDQT